MKGLICAHCGHEFGISIMADTMKMGEPKKGDLSVCARCASIIKFDGDKTMIELTPEECFFICVNMPDHWDLLIKIRRVALERLSE